MDCETASRDGLAAKYVTGQLPPGLLEEYERHYFECSACYGELQVLTAVRQALAETRAQQPATLQSPPPKQTPPILMSGWRWPAVLALAATVLGVVVLLRQQAPMPTATVAGTGEPETVARAPAVTPPETAAKASESVAEPVTRSPELRSTGRLARLARVDPPRYSPSVLRGEYDEATRLFEDGMQSYAAGDYASATPLLRKAAVEDSRRVDIAFFLAASELMTGDLAAARAGFQGVVKRGASPFTPEAHYYLAKIALTGGEIDTARAEFQQVVKQGGPLAADATAVLDELDGLDGP